MQLKRLGQITYILSYVVLAGEYLYELLLMPCITYIKIKAIFETIMNCLCVKTI